MKKLILSVFACLVIAACGGGGDDNTIVDPPDDDDDGGGTVTISSVTLQTSSPQLPSDGSAPVEITAFVRGANNEFLADVPVTFQADSGGLAVTQGTTDDSGIATASLSPAGDPANRTITVTATAGTVSDTITVAVSGTLLSLSGSASLVQGQQAAYTITLTDAGGDGIANREVTIDSTAGNTLSADSVTTDANGTATVTVTGSVAGADTLSASALGLTAQRAITISNDSFAFSTPAASTEIELGQIIALTVDWTLGGNGQPNAEISFSTTRGTLFQDAGGTIPATTATTNGNGEATIWISSTNAGPATITATTDTGSTTQLPVEFVAITPATINVQASPTTIATGAQSTITAVVRDAQGNLVKNRTVAFTLADVTGGQLSVGSAITDSQGRAQTIYTASSTTSSTNGVTVTGAVQGVTPAIQSSASLTVARREVFISLGTGNEIDEPNTAQYSIEYAIQVTDANGNGVANVPLTVRILSNVYYAGIRQWNGDVHETLVANTCRDEDSVPGTGFRNGILDAGEDVNNSGRLEAGNVATVTPSSVTTDANGFALVNVVYPQELAYWVYVELSAMASVEGSEYVRSVVFDLPGLASDFTSEDIAPPGPISPFGATDPNCVAP